MLVLQNVLVYNRQALGFFLKPHRTLQHFQNVWVPPFIHSNFQIECEEFISQFEKLYATKWTEVQDQINAVIKDVMRTLSRFCLFIDASS